MDTGETTVVVIGILALTFLGLILIVAWHDVKKRQVAEMARSFRESFPAGPIKRWGQNVEETQVIKKS